MSDAIEIRAATIEDATIVARHRVRSSLERDVDVPEVAAYLAACERVIAEALGDRSLRAWLAFAAGDAIGTASLQLSRSLPRPGAGKAALDGRVRNVYVEPAFRRRGVAMLLMQCVLAEAERERVDRLTLGASDEGRPLYERLGFVAKSDEMIYRGAS
ncbi:MAG TPA: GNAT family N-acetyltransferase [Candidatus Baltobacteraceae bacterium]|nr:GNAT family N-acetyltransferase [Candidatus Baltobacteraceae bacterium]